MERIRFLPVPMYIDRYTAHFGRGGRVRFTEGDERDQGLSDSDIIRKGTASVARRMLDRPHDNVVLRDELKSEAESHQKEIREGALAIVEKFNTTGEFPNDAESQIGHGCTVLLRCKKGDFNDAQFGDSVGITRQDDPHGGEELIRLDFPDGGFREVERGLQVIWDCGANTGLPKQEHVFKNAQFVHAEGHRGGIIHRKGFTWDGGRREEA